MKDIRAFLKSKAEKYDIFLSDAQLSSFQLYLEEMLKTNEYMNLTAITEPDEVAIKHFLDSLLLLRACPPLKACSVADVGTGAGFPGVPLKIVRRDIELYLIDSLNKRLLFLDSLLDKMSLSANIIHSRAEDCGREAEFRERFDYVTARAVANLSSLAEYCLPLVKKGGVFVAMKSVKIEDELKAAENAVTVLGGRIEKIEALQIDGNIERSYVVIRKERQTPPDYPRRGVKIAKKPI